MTCPSSSTLFNLINNSLISTLNTSSLDITNNLILNLHQQIKNLNSMTIHNSSNKPSLITTLTGLIPNDIISTINETTLSYKLASTLTIKFLLHLNQQIYKQI